MRTPAPDLAIDVQPLPALAAGGHITFGSFNKLSKVNASVIALWGRPPGRVKLPA